MCGVFAAFGEQVDGVGLTRAIEALGHRGPDARRTWVSPNGRVGLAHARLAIIDLEGGSQPLTSDDESVRAVVNGEIYDFERERRALEALGHRFRTNSDSELLLHLYERYGAACVSRLRGEIAFLLYDARADLLLAGRDRFGIKPLFYANHGATLLVASEAKALFAYGLAPRWDSEAFLEGCVLGGAAAEDRSIFAGVHAVPPAHVLVATRRHRRLLRYWDFDFPRSDQPVTSDEARDVDALHASLDEAVQLRLRADVEVGCYLSGGIDSCTVLALAARHARRPVRAFTVSFEHPAYDEEPLAREMAARVGAEYTPVLVTQSDLAHGLEDAVWHAERALTNGNGVAKFWLSRAARDAGVRAVLTGEGADEILAGYPHFRRDWMLHERTEPTALEALSRGNLATRGSSLPDGDALPLNAVTRALGVVPTWLEMCAAGGKKLHAALSPRFAKLASEYDPAAAFMSSLDVERQLRGRHPLHQAMYTWARSVLSTFVLSVVGDRMEMAHGVEGRVPFLDHHVVEVVRQMPVDRLIREGTEKWLLRRVARPLVTPAILARQKHPFTAPPATTSDGGPLFELMQDTLRSSLLGDLPFFEPRSFIALLDRLPHLDEATRTAMDAPLMVALSLCLLQRRFHVTDCV